MSEAKTAETRAPSGDETPEREEPLVVGTFGAFGGCGPLAADTFRRSVESALARGCRTFDVAPSWGDSVRAMGELLAGLSGSAQARFITRCGVRLQAGQLERDYRRPALERDLERSLDHLQVDKIDTWLLHDPPLESLNEAMIGHLVEQQSAGKIRAFGVTTQRLEVAQHALALGVDVLMLPYNLLWTDLVDALCDPAPLPTRTKLITRTPLMHGLLAGRWSPYKQFPADDHRSARWTSVALRNRLRALRKLDPHLRGEIAELLGLALRFVLSHPQIDACVLGVRRPGHLQDALDALGAAPYLTPHTREAVARAAEQLA